MEIIDKYRELNRTDGMDMIKLPMLDLNFINWDMEDLIERSCPICASDQVSLKMERADTLILNLCQVCGLYYINPVPSEKQITEFYVLKYTSGRPRPIMRNYRYGNPVDDYRFCEVLSYGVKDKNVLDVGFGNGEFISYFHQCGAHVWGCEPHTIAFEEVDNYFKNNDVRLSQGTLEETNYPSDFFDIITVGDVIEHVLNPALFLDKLVEILRPDGILVLITPNGDNYNMRSIQYFHIQFFTLSLLKRIAEMLDLDLIHLEENSIADWDNVSEIIPERTFTTYWKTWLRNVIRGLPGMWTLLKYYHRLRPKQDERLGRDKLLAIYRKKT